MSKLSDKQIHLTYKGPFPLDIVSSLGELIRSLPNAPLTQSRLFKSFIEVAQNISLHSAERITLQNGHQTGLGTLKIEEDDVYFRIITKNKIDKLFFEKLNVYCNQISNLSLEELRALKKLHIKNKKETENSAHLGFIYITLLTLNNIEFKIDTEHSSFKLIVKVNKNYAIK